jgi:hypothetical protein
VLRSPGQPLDTASRTFFESRFGYDFGRVRVHADTQAARAARVIGALAYNGELHRLWPELATPSDFELRHFGPRTRACGAAGSCRTKRRGVCRRHVRDGDERRRSRWASGSKAS